MAVMHGTVISKHADGGRSLVFEKFSPVDLRTLGSAVNAIAVIMMNRIILNQDVVIAGVKINPCLISVNFIVAITTLSDPPLFAAYIP
jgi:hypothetical protein